MISPLKNLKESKLMLSLQNNNNIQKAPKGISARQRNVLKRKANTEYQKKLLKRKFAIEDARLMCLIAKSYQKNKMQG